MCEDKNALAEMYMFAKTGNTLYAYLIFSDYKTY